MISYITFAVELTVQILSWYFPKIYGNKATRVNRHDIIIWIVAVVIIPFSGKVGD